MIWIILKMSFFSSLDPVHLKLQKKVLNKS